MPPRHDLAMALKPLEQWYCDRCSDVIEKPTDLGAHPTKKKALAQEAAIFISKARAARK